jgi:hypothetical protein
MESYLAIAIILMALIAVRLATAFGSAGRNAAGMRGLVGRAVRIKVRGEALPGPLEVVSITAFGAGLWIYLALPSGKRGLLKLTRPALAELQESRIVITTARFVRWEGRRLEGDPSAPAFVLDEVR